MNTNTKGTVATNNLQGSGNVQDIGDKHQKSGLQQIFHHSIPLLCLICKKN